MSPLKKIVMLLIQVTFVLVFGLMAFIPFLWNTLVKGPKYMFYVKKRETRPEVLDDPDLGTHKFARLKNIRLHYVESGPEDKPLMLMIHGFPEFWYSWRHQIREFGKEFRVVAMDMRGYGESEKPSGIKSYRIDQLVTDVEELIHYLGYEKAHVVAHDWGGAIAWNFAAKNPDMVEKLVCCNCPYPATLQKLASKSFAQVLRSWYIFVFQWPIFPVLFLRAGDLKFVSEMFVGKHGCKPGRITADDIEAFKYTFQYYNDLECPVHYYRAALRHPSVDPRFRARVTKPTLMIWGTGDFALGRELPEMSAEYVDDYRIKYVDGASHWVQQDEPELVNKHIREFICGSTKE